MWRLWQLSLSLLAWPVYLGATESVLDFARDVRPILSDRCFQCHGPDEEALKADLRLDRAESAYASQAIVPGKPEQSEILTRILSSDPDEVMPPPKAKKSVSPAEVEILRRWIEEGAVYQGHWAFEPLASVEPPTLEAGALVEHPIDRFIYASLAAEGISPSPEADPATLIRRLSLDLTGLLPAPDRVKSFLREHREDPDRAVAKLADELLASPHYGERWGRHWLDQARYADSNGYSIDGDRSMWPYRDWVIRALNDDLPFDQFTIEQIAGDLLPDATTAQLVATGFHRNTLINQEGGSDAEQFRNEEVIDRVNTTGAVWLGLTLSCAQCHTHKYDPITHREYYELFAFFNSGTDVNSVGATLEVSEGELFLDDPDPAALERIKAARASLAVLEASSAARQEEWERGERERIVTGEIPTPLQAALLIDPKERSREDKRLLSSAFNRQDSEKQAAEKGLRDALAALKLGRSVKTMVMQDLPRPRETYVQLRGSFLDLDHETGPLQPGVPAILPPLPRKLSEGERATRLDLAHWLVRPDHPLTPRVTVNRVWMRYFGTGLVSTENDFGIQGSYPSHPALLDWLAREFVENDWSLKALHRLIVTSATYRQSSHARPDLHEIDPLNTLLARQNRVRVEAEIIRDAALSASGLLSPKIGGPGVRPPQPEGIYAFTQHKKSWVAASGSDRYRRGLYTQFYRSAPYPLLSTFDTPDFQSVCTARVRSNTPLQALTLANDAALYELAEGLGARLDKAGRGEGDEARADVEARLELAFLLCYARTPSASEREAVLAFREQQERAFQADGRSSDASRLASWTAVARALMNTDEFITRE